MSDDFSVHEVEEYGLHLVMTRRRIEAGAFKMAEHAVLDLPLTPNTTSGHSGERKAIWFGPGRWLIFSAEPEWRPGEIAGCAVTDVSDSRRVFRLTGTNVRERISRGCPLDLSGTAMPPGSCASSHFHQLPILLCHDGDDAYEIYVERSYCRDLLKAI